MYPNLLAEMTRAKVTKKDIADVLKVSMPTVYRKLEQRALTYDEALTIRDAFFVGLSIEYLLSKTAEVTDVAICV